MATSTTSRITRNSGKAAALNAQRHAQAVRAALPMPGDVRLMNVVASTVFVLAALGLVAGGVLWLMRSPMFPIRSIVLDGDLVRNSVLTVRANAMPRLAGNFFSVDLRQARAAFESVPWVRHAVVRRVWPDQLVVHLEEHQAAALWQGADEERSADRLVNTFGEVFEANVGELDTDSDGDNAGDGNSANLPSFSGPDGSAAHMLALYRRLQPTLATADMAIGSMHVSGRGSWRVLLLGHGMTGGSGGAAIELGRGSNDELVARCERFARTVAVVSGPHGRWHQPLEYADLRHTDGYAVRLRGVSTTVAAAPVAARPVRSTGNGSAATRKTNQRH